MAATKPVAKPATISQNEPLAQKVSRVNQYTASVTKAPAKEPIGKIIVSGCKGCPAIATVLGTPGSRYSLSSLSIIGGIFGKGVPVLGCVSIFSPDKNCNYGSV
jgi:hypothetical protein